MPKTPTDETPFSLAFDTEAVISVEVRIPSIRIENFDGQTNSERQHANLDLLEEVREIAQIRMIAYQYKMARYFNFRVRNKTFRIGDLVLC